MSKQSKSTKQAARDKAKTAPKPEISLDGNGVLEQSSETQMRNEAQVAEDTTAEQASAPAPAKPARVLPTPAEALATATAKQPVRYAHVVSVTELTKDGEPKRVVIECADPQTKQGPDGNRVSVCETTREIAVQDLFQVLCCAACADRKVRIARRNRAKSKNRALRQAIKDAKQA